ncbi:MAG: cardiolipin synthase [Erysipelothrix sp.]|nr:cardiolipin synthase [Erysipelothrix sp.]
MLKRIFKFLSSRLVLVVLLLVLQLYIVIELFGGLPPIVDIILTVIGLFIVIELVNSSKNQSISVAWIVIILLIPGFGALIYLMFANKQIPKGLRRLKEQKNLDPALVLPQDTRLLEEIKLKSKSMEKQFEYILRAGSFPVYENTDVDYYPVGEDKLASMLIELEKAEKYIFLEYFIIREGIMWNSMLDILIKKVRQGVDVRVMYDDAGTITNLPDNYQETLESYGIKVHVFNKLRPVMLVQMNNRDHRKILSIDGKVGYLGGINLGDEYVNRLERFGHWKDSAIKLEGAAVWSLTVMFLQFWNVLNNIEEDIEVYNPNYEFTGQGYVQPYSDSPTDGEALGENIHLNFIINSKKYLYIMTPYLIPSNEMKRMLILTSKSGVDVRIIVPHKPDKWYVHAVTQSNYADFIANGVRIYEYKPGFIHSKNLLSDDTTGIVGSANLDFRSYYLNFESGAIMYKTKAIDGLIKDFEETIAASIEITEADVLNTSRIKRAIRQVIGVFSPLL